MIKNLNSYPIPPKNYDVHKGDKIPKDYMEVAKGMETQFLHHMFNELRKTVHKSEPESQATDYYNSLQDYERSKILADSPNGIGLKDMILDEIFYFFALAGFLRSLRADINHLPVKCLFFWENNAFSF